MPTQDTKYLKIIFIITTPFQGLLTLITKLKSLTRAWTDCGKNPWLSLSWLATRAQNYMEKFYNKTWRISQLNIEQENKALNCEATHS